LKTRQCVGKVWIGKMNKERGEAWIGVGNKVNVKRDIVWIAK
jgi:hypothetical protein